MSMDKASAIQALEALNVGSYTAELEVRQRTLLKTSWRKCQVILTCQTLEILDDNGIVLSCSLEHCTTRAHRSAENRFQFELREHGKTIGMFRTPTESARDEFLQHFDKLMLWRRQEPNKGKIWSDLIAVAERIIRKKVAEFRLQIPRTKISVQQVQEHVLSMKAVYDHVATISDIEGLYSTFLNWERNYFNGIRGNFAHHVHLLHPFKYSPKAKYRLALGDILTHCPHSECGAPFPLLLVYKMHILNDEFDCAACGGTVRYETYSIARFVKAASRYKEKYTMKSKEMEIDFMTPPVPKDGKWTTMLATLKENMATKAPKMSRDAFQKMKSFYSSQIKCHRTSSEGAFALDLVQGMFRQLDFVNKMCPHFEYWMNPIVIEASIYRYEKFMHLMSRRDQWDVLVPTSDIDLVWHTHQIHRDDYINFCKDKTKCLVNHDDTIPGGDLAEGYATTFVIWSKTFDEAYSSFPPSYNSWPNSKAPDAQKEWTKYSAVSQGIDRFYGVNEPFDISTIPYAAVITKAHAVDLEEMSGKLVVYLTVIGTPVMDGRVRQPYTWQNALMYRSGLPYYYKPQIYANGCGGFGYYGSTDVSSTGNYLAMNSNSAGCSTGCGTGGCSSGCGDYAYGTRNGWGSWGISGAGYGGGVRVGGGGASGGGGGCGISGFGGGFVSGCGGGDGGGGGGDGGGGDGGGGDGGGGGGGCGGGCGC